MRVIRQSPRNGIMIYIVSRGHFAICRPNSDSKCPSILSHTEKAPNGCLPSAAHVDRDGNAGLVKDPLPG